MNGVIEDISLNTDWFPILESPISSDRRASLDSARAATTEISEEGSPRENVYQIMNATDINNTDEEQEQLINLIKESVDVSKLIKISESKEEKMFENEQEQLTNKEPVNISGSTEVSHPTNETKVEEKMFEDILKEINDIIERNTPLPNNEQNTETSDDESLYYKYKHPKELQGFDDDHGFSKQEELNNTTDNYRIAMNYLPRFTFSRRQRNYLFDNSIVDVGTPLSITDIFSNRYVYYTVYKQDEYTNIIYSLNNPIRRTIDDYIVVRVKDIKEPTVTTETEFWNMPPLLKNRLIDSKKINILPGGILEDSTVNHSVVSVYYSMYEGGTWVRDIQTNHPLVYVSLKSSAFYPPECDYPKEDVKSIDIYNNIRDYYIELNPGLKYTNNFTHSMIDEYEKEWNKEHINEQSNINVSQNQEVQTNREQSQDSREEVSRVLQEISKSLNQPSNGKKRIIFFYYSE